MAGFRAAAAAVRSRKSLLSSLAGLCAGSAAAGSLLASPAAPVLMAWIWFHNSAGGRVRKLAGFAQYVEAWKAYGFHMEAGRSIVLNSWYVTRFRSDQLITEPQCWATLDYSTVEDPNVKAEIHWAAKRVGTAHGLCVWFDATLVEGVSFSNAPGAPELIYQSGFFPWSAPVEITARDAVICTLEANRVGGDYLWRWESRVLEQGDPARVRADFKQSTFFGVPLSPQQLRKRAESHKPDLNEEGRIDRFILGQMGEGVTLGEIANRVVQQFPDRFTSREEALARVGELSLKHSL